MLKAAVFPTESDTKESLTSKGGNLVNFINAKKFAIIRTIVSLAREAVFLLKNQVYKAVPENPKLFDRKVIFRNY